MTTTKTMTTNSKDQGMIGSIVLHMYLSEKTDRVIWQVTDATGAPILGRAQAKLMNYLSYPKIHLPPEQSPVSQDSLKSTDYIHSLKTTKHSLQRLHSLWTVSRLHPKPT